MADTYIFEKNNKAQQKSRDEIQRRDKSLPEPHHIPALGFYTVPINSVLTQDSLPLENPKSPNNLFFSFQGIADFTQIKEMAHKVGKLVEPLACINN